MMIEVDYFFPDGVDAKKQAGVIAVGQTAGTWSDRFSYRDGELRAHLAEVVNVGRVEGGHVATIAFPRSNVENDIPSLLTMIFGKYSMAGLGRVIAVRLPADYGLLPKFGMSGIRGLLGVYDRPLVMAIFKPALGLNPQDHANILRQVAFAGLDVIKDDEILGDVVSCPRSERLRECLKVIDELKRTTGRTMLYAVNVTGNAVTIMDRARELVRSGANALLLNVLSYGFAVLEALAGDPLVDVPIFAHPALAGALGGSPVFGMAYNVVLGSLMAHGGADAVLYPAHYGSLPISAEEEGRIRDILRSRNVFCVPSAGIRCEIVPNVLQDYGRDVILNSGTGIMDHVDGPAGGVRAFFDNML